jgi:two-component system nitrogen regulation response regulator NtrX
MPSILIVDDEPNIRRMVGALLGAEGYEVRDASDAAAGLARAVEYEPDLVLLDLMMPNPTDGLELLEQLRGRFPDLPVVMMSGRAGLADAVKATRLGAVNFLEKPLTPEGVLLAIASALELRQARRERSALRADLGLAGELVGDSPAMRAVREMIGRVAPSDARVLILGETGTGKEVVARALHRHSRRAGRPFVAVNCAALPETLAESELFGHERGSFTGAQARKPGLFEAADGGTLLLDEVGELSASNQARLLRVLQERAVHRVGAVRPTPVDVRVLGATNRDLAVDVARGRFREDLYFRLNGVTLQVPPLRERPGDVLPLARRGLDERGGGYVLAESAAEALRAYPWPGNVRELANIVERLSILFAGQDIGTAEVASVIPAGEHTTAKPPALPDGERLDVALSEALDEYERLLIARAMSAANGVVAEAARRLQTDRPNLYRRMKRLGIAGAAE